MAKSVNTQFKEQIKVGPIAYLVEYVEGLRDDEGQLLYGDANHIKHKIRLATEHTRESDFTTRWHEVVHCIDALYDLHMTEQDVNLMSCAIAQVLQDNPQMNWSEVRNGGQG